MADPGVSGLTEVGEGAGGGLSEEVAMGFSRSEILAVKALTVSDNAFVFFFLSFPETSVSA